MPGALVDALDTSPVLSVELRPPRAELDPSAGRDAWIDTYHAVRGLVRHERFVFLTDSAVGASEEHTLRHLVINLGPDVRRDHVVPFLTTKHSIEFCLAYAERTRHEGFGSLVVLGGDKTVGQPRCVPHAWRLRALIRQQVPDLPLGGWANPHADPDAQAGFVAAPDFTAEYFLTQVVSHHDVAALERFLAALTARDVSVPGIFGVFYYRSASRRTLERLRQFLPVPVEALTAEFAAGATADEICARTIRALRDAGVQHLYISNLPVDRARRVLDRVMALV